MPPLLPCSAWTISASDHIQLITRTHQGSAIVFQVNPGHTVQVGRLWRCSSSGRSRHYRYCSGRGLPMGTGVRGQILYWYTWDVDALKNRMEGIVNGKAIAPWSRSFHAELRCQLTQLAVPFELLYERAYCCFATVLFGKTGIGDRSAWLTMVRWSSCGGGNYPGCRYHRYSNARHWFSWSETVRFPKWCVEWNLRQAGGRCGYGSANLRPATAVIDGGPYLKRTVCIRPCISRSNRNRWSAVHHVKIHCNGSAVLDPDRFRSVFRSLVVDPINASARFQEPVTRVTFPHACALNRFQMFQEKLVADRLMLLETGAGDWMVENSSVVTRSFDRKPGKYPGNKTPKAAACWWSWLVFLMKSVDIENIS